MNLRLIIKQDQLVDFIVGVQNGNVRRPEEDTARWNQLIDFYRFSATKNEKQYIGDLLLTMFSSNQKEKQLPAIIISRILKLPDMRAELKRVIQAGTYDTYDNSVQRSILVSITYFQIKSLCPFLLDTLSQKRILKNFITWSDRPLDETTTTEHDLWRMESLAKYYEASNKQKKDDIAHQILSLPKRHKKASTIMKEFFDRAENYPNFRKLLRSYFSES